jgi:hypothetical protein
MPFADPLILYIAAALAVAAILTLFLTFKREVHITVHRERKRVDAMLKRLEGATPSLPPPEPVYIPVSLRPGLNLTRRVHAVRMLKRGDETAHIAAALGIPIREVELLVRVQKIVAETVPTRGGSPAG